MPGSKYQNLKSIFAGWAAAAALMWAMWQSVGAIYSHSIPWVEVYRTV